MARVRVIRRWEAGWQALKSGARSFCAVGQGGYFAQAVHRFPQRFDQNLIDGASGDYYLARQIDPGSLRPLRLSLEDAASLTAGCSARLNCEARSLYGSVWSA